MVKLKGLPFEATKDKVIEFFGGLEIEDNDVHIVRDFRGRASGVAFVQFTSAADAASALQKNKQRMGRRYIEVFKSSMEEAERGEKMTPGSCPPRVEPMRDPVGGVMPPCDMVVQPVLCETLDKMSLGHNQHTHKAVHSSHCGKLGLEQKPEICQKKKAEVNASLVEKKQADDSSLVVQLEMEIVKLKREKATIQMTNYLAKEDTHHLCELREKQRQSEKEELEQRFEVEYKEKLELFVALGDAKRQLQMKDELLKIKEDMLMVKDREIQILKAGIMEGTKGLDTAPGGHRAKQGTFTPYTLF